MTTSGSAPWPVRYGHPLDKTEHVDGGDQVGRDRGFEMLAGLLEASHLSTAEQLPGLVSAHAAPAGFHDIRMFVVDLRQESLVRFQGDDDDGEILPVDSTLAGRAFRNVELITTSEADELHTWLPLLDGTERLGVMRVTTTHMNEQVADGVRVLAALVALLVVSKRPHSDTLARLTRSRPMSVAAEVVWPLVPPLSFATDDFVVSGVLEPAYDIGGDTVDYAVAGDRLYLSIFDAMGHDRAAGLTASLATATCRTSRRESLDLPETSSNIDKVIGEQFDRRRFATGILAELDRSTGVLHVVNRGHPLPLLIRGGRWLMELNCPPTPPMGFQLDIRPQLCRVQLQAGDRLLLYTDGVIEARDEEGHEFGARRFADFVIRHESDGFSAPETLRRLMRAVLRHQRGRLQDDATVLMVDWRSDRQSRMVTSRLPAKA